MYVLFVKTNQSCSNVVIMELEIQNINTDINFLSVRNLTIFLSKN